MQRIDKSEYEKRMVRIGEIFAGISEHADVQAKMRCPYKNRLSQCTAGFGCRNKRKPVGPGELPVCASDDKLDYRTAWEAEPDGYEQLKSKIGTGKRQQEERQVMGQVSHDQESRPAAVGKTIFDYADELNVRIPTSCGRTGYCHECVVEIMRGMDALAPPTEAEGFLSGNFRLACQAVVDRAETDVEFALPRHLPQILTSSSNGQVELDPVVTRRDDKVYYDDEVVDKFHGHIFGLALDVGTTTVVVELVDLESGQTVRVSALENPQRFGGSDVMHRISYDGGVYHGELHRAIINALNTEIRLMCAELDVNRREIYELVVVGNSTMRDLFFDLDVQPIGQRPYKSTIEQAYLAGERDTTTLSSAARKLGIYANPNARVFGAPLIASHIGGDMAANLVAVDMASHDEVAMLVDAGTNTEVVIGNKDRLIAASCPAGPAFEGGLVTYGMPGCEGAIEAIRYVGSDHEGANRPRESAVPAEPRFEYKTIGGVEPRGICGSGLIDLLAELSRHGLMAPKGVFADRVGQFTIVPEHGITFSRNDASELAQAKAANYCGQIILMRKFGVVPEQISRLYLAGGFANYVDTANAIDIGFLAPVPLDRVVKVGNAAAQGAREMLLSRNKRQSIERLVKTIEHVELETMPDFFEVFTEGCQIKPMVVPQPGA